MWSKLFKLKRFLHPEVIVEGILKRLDSFNKSIVHVKEWQTKLKICLPYLIAFNKCFKII